MPRMRTRVVVKYNHFGRVAAALPVRTSQVVRKAAMDIRDQAASRAPVKSGTLKGEITWESLSQTSARVHSAAYYSAYVNYGTRYQSANPYFTQAVEAVKPAYVAAMTQLLRSLR